MALEQTFFIAVIFIMLALTMMVIGRYVWTCLKRARGAQAAGNEVEPSWFSPLVMR